MEGKGLPLYVLDLCVTGTAGKKSAHSAVLSQRREDTAHSCFFVTRYQKLTCIQHNFSLKPSFVTENHQPSIYIYHYCILKRANDFSSSTGTQMHPCKLNMVLKQPVASVTS